jgi:hypothetical protein
MISTLFVIEWKDDFNDFFAVLTWITQFTFGATSLASSCF